MDARIKTQPRTYTDLLSVKKPVASVVRAAGRAQKPSLASELEE